MTQFQWGLFYGRMRKAATSISDEIPTWGFMYKDLTGEELPNIEMHQKNIEMISDNLEDMNLEFKRLQNENAKLRTLLQEC